MKRLICVMSVCALVLGMAGCGREQAEMNQTKTNQTETEHLIEQKATAEETYLYLGSDNADGFTMEYIELEELTPENLLSALAGKGVIPEEVQALSFEKDGEELTLDLSKDYQEYVDSCGTAGEWAAVGSLVNTFLGAYDAQTITILVEGEALEIGHADYSGPLSWY